MSNSENFIEFLSAINWRLGQSLQEWAFCLLQNLAERTDALQAAFYTADSKSEYIYLTATYNHNSAGELNQKIAFGEGLIGLVAKEKKVVHLGENIPEQFSNTTAFHKIVPRSLLILPIVYNEITYAVVEFTSIDSFSTESINFIDSIIKTVGIQLILLIKEKQLSVLVNELEGKSKEIQTKSEEIQMQNEAMQEQNEALELQSKKLDAVNKTKDRFLSIIAHDLKNPISALLTNSTLLYESKDDFTSDELHQMHRMINFSAKHIYTLLENLLSWARTQTSSIAFNPENIDIKEIIDENINLLKTNADNKQINLQTNLHKPRLVYVDANMIKTVIRNLITNAIKFTHEYGSIDVLVQNKGEFVQISVRDTGVGIRKEAQDKLFNIGEYFSSEGTKNEKGTGLGLIICKEFVEKNNGEIWIESETGKGATFHLTLPKGNDKR